MEFLGQNHGLTLLRKSNVWDLNKEHFYNKERHLFFISRTAFLSKLAISPFSTFKQNTPGNVFQDILETKKAFLDYKSNNFKKLKIGFF